MCAVIVQDGEGNTAPCTLAGFGAVLCGVCHEAFVGTFKLGDPHRCGAVIVELHTHGLPAQDHFEASS